MGFQRIIQPRLSWCALLGFALLLSACHKESIVDPDENQLLTQKRDLRYIFRSSDNSRFLIRNAGGCTYGTTADNTYCYISSFASGGGIQASNGICNYPTYPSPLQLRRGATVGSLGPVYYVVPHQPTSGAAYTALKLQVRNVASSIPDSYNVGFSYENSTNTWSWHPDAPLMFSITVVPNYYVYLCPPK